MKLPSILLFLYVVLFAVCAIGPHDRAVWWAENLPIVATVAGIAFVSRSFRFSNTAYVMMAVLPALHTIGGHFTFELVPFGAVTDFFGFERNHYNRVAHFTVGFYAYAMAEYLAGRSLVRGRALQYGVPVVTILAIAGAYEIIEWLYAASADPGAGAAFLGSQGDIWDAQKDMLADTLGGVVAVCLFAVGGPLERAAWGGAEQNQAG